MTYVGRPRVFGTTVSPIEGRRERLGLSPTEACTGETRKCIGRRAMSTPTHSGQDMVTLLLPGKNNVFVSARFTYAMVL
jgi:hypothetical protein